MNKQRPSAGVEETTLVVRFVNPPQHLLIEGRQVEAGEVLDLSVHVALSAVAFGLGEPVGWDFKRVLFEGCGDVLGPGSERQTLRCSECEQGVKY